MKKYYILSIVYLITFFSTTVYAQTISYPVSAKPISVSFDSTIATVQVNGANVNSTVTITLPTGVFYIPNSFTIIVGSGSVVASGTSSIPVFSITGASNTFTFTLKRRADCSARTFALGGGTFKDIVKVDAVTENAPLLNTYNIKYPTLTITQPASLINVALGSNIVRSFSFRNTGQGCLDTAFLEIDYGIAGLLPNGDIVADGVNFSPSPSLSTSTKKVYKIFGLSTMIGGLCDSDPAINVTQPVSVTSCTQVATNYKVSWGNNGTQLCQGGITTGNLTVLNTIPLLSSVVTATPSVIPFCAGSPYASFTATINNTGNGPAGNVKFFIANFSGNNFQNQASMAIDTLSVLINGSHPNGIFVSTAPSWRLVKATGSPFCSVGMPAQCLITMPPAFTIPAGGSITITWNVTVCKGGVCGDGFSGGLPGVKMEYDNECGSQRTTSAAQTISYGVFNQIFGQVIQLPAQVISGDCFNYLVDFNASLGAVSGGNNINRYAELKLTLPVGMSIASLSNDVREMLNSLVPHTGYPKQSGQDVYFRFYPNITNSVRFRICTAVGGPPCGITFIPIEISMVNDSSCSVANRITSRRCLSKSIEVLCPGSGCSLGGVSPRAFSIYRSSYGLPDNNQDGKPDAAGTVDFNKIDRDRYRPGDTLRSEYRGVVLNQTSPSSISNWSFVLAEWSFSTGTWQAATADITLKRGAITYTASKVSVSALTATKYFRVNWSNIAFTPAFPAGGYVAGDSVIITANFMYLPPQVTVGRLTTVSDVGYDAPVEVLLTQMVYAAQSVPASPVVNGTTGFTCSVIKYNGNIIGHQNLITLSGAVGSACNNIASGFTSNTGLLGGFSQKQYFNYEYRPIAKADSIIYKIPAGWEYNGPLPSSYFYTTKSGASSTFPATLTPLISGSTTAGYTLKYDIKSAYSSGTFPFVGTEGLYFSESISFRPSCNTPDTVDISVVEYGHFTSYPNKLNPAAYVNSNTALKAITYSGSSRPEVILTNNTGVVEAATENNNYWDVQITGANFNAAKYIWLATEKLSGNGIDVSRVEHPIGTPLPIANTYGIGKNIYNIASTATTGLANPNFIVVRVYFSKTDCGTDSLKVRTGWDCGVFTTSPELSCSKDIFVKSTSSISEIQLLKVQEPAPNAPIDVCSDINYKIKITSTQKGDLDNPIVKVTLPIGMQLVGNNFTYEYPENTNPEVFTIVPVNNVFTLNLEDHSLIPVTGLNGLKSASNNTQRVAFVSMKLRVNSCSFVNGVSPSFQIFGDRPCDGAAVGNTLTVIGNPVVAATQAAVPSFTETMSVVGSNNINCNAAVTVRAVIVSGNGHTVAGDSAVYIFPDQLKYKTGTFTITSGTISSSTLTDKKMVIRFGAKTSNNVTFEFGITAADAGCSFTNYNLIGNLYRSTGYLCPLTFGSCQIAEIKDRDTVKLQMSRPQLSATANTFIQSVQPGSVTVNYTINVANNGNAVAAASTYIGKVFCGTTSNGKVLHTFNIGMVGIGAEVPHTGTFTVNIPVSCADGNVTFIQIQDTTLNGAKACMCEKPAGYIAVSGQSLANSLEHFSAEFKKEAVMINWTIGQETDLRQYEIEYSANATDYSYIGTVMATGKRVYEFLHSISIAGSYYYRLKIISKNSTFSYSSVRRLNIAKNETVFVYPNPASHTINIKLPFTIGNKAAVITMYGMDGRLLIMQKIATAGQYAVIDVSKFTNGKYHIRIATSTAVFDKIIEVLR